VTEGGKQQGAFAMTESSPSRSSETSLIRDLFDAARYYLRGRRGIVILASVAIVGGLALSWGWLVAAGIAPVLLTLLPCAAMCALGLCMNRMGGRSCSTDTSASPTSRGSGADDTPTPVYEIPPLALAETGAGDPEATAVTPTPATIESKPQQEKEPTNA
jgi:hypothetical protein